MRDLSDVMKSIRPLLVLGGVDVSDFDKITNSIGFTAPEDMRMRWRQACEWLAENIPPPVAGAPAWVLEISDIVEGRKP